MSHCEHCPLAQGVPCPSTWDWPGWCGWAAKENGSGPWTDKLHALAGVEPPARAVVAADAARVERSRPPSPSATSMDPRVRDAILACPERGPEGGGGVEPGSCGSCGGGAELTACSAGRGKVPGKVTLRECIACKS